MVLLLDKYEIKKKTVNKHRALKIAFNSFIHHFIY